MILKPTALILGAGASKPYGYPLGEELVSKIIDITSPNGALTSVLSENPDAFHRRLRDSSVASIDDFLESNPEFEVLGKLGIAACLTLFGPPFDHPTDPSDGLYKYLWNRLHEGARNSTDFRRNQLKIITYNYDASFERYFTRVLGNMYPDLAEGGELAAAKFLSEVIWIKHLHGTVGKSDDLVRQEADRKTFLRLDFFKEAAAGIRIVHEDESEEYQKAHEWLSEAECVYVLGFGYHPTNVQRLDLVRQRQKKGGWHAWGGTALGLEPAERNRIHNALQMGNFTQPVDSLKFLRTYAVLE